MTRPTTHPDARAVESAAIDADAGLARGSNRDVRKNVLVLLAEVAGEPGVTHLRAELARTEDPEAAVDVMRALETVYGLPAFYEPHALQCGEPGPPDVTRAIMDQHRTGEARRFVEGRRALLAWLDANAGVPRERRVREAFRAWDERHWIAQPNTSPEGIGFTTVLRYATIVRLGDDALPELRARRDAAAANDDLAEAGRFETLRAAIHGEVDRALVRRLLDDESDHRAVMYGVEAIGAAADQRWVPELDALQLSTMDEVANLSSHTLALILGAEAVPMLRAAAAKNRDNYTAGAFADTLTGR